MAYRLPPATEVTQAIESQLHPIGTFGSQATFHKAVTAWLKEQNPEYRLGPTRLRRLALNSGLVKIDIFTRNRRKEGEYVNCPVCSSEFDVVHNSTLDGGRVALGFKCQTCGFFTGQKAREPARYQFHWAGQKIKLTHSKGETDSEGL